MSIGEFETVGSYGLMAEFDSPRRLIAACEAAREAGYTKMDAYTPYPIEAVWEALGHHRSKLPFLVLLGGLTGAVGGFLFQYWAASIAYPMNVGGRPLNSWVAFIVPSFEMMILFAAFAAVLGMFILNGLPMPYHPAFNVKRFAQASRDRYFLLIAEIDPRFDAADTRRFLEGLAPVEVADVEE
ncbi:MAG: DUF3341 domain-containing protein [Thermoanaerobaculia bacterium]